jgi:magnesium chelatase family protein
MRANARFAVDCADSGVAGDRGDVVKLAIHARSRAMTLATILSRTQQGLDAPLVRVEVDSSGGLPTFSIVGLPEAVVKESKDRVRAAIANCGFEFPVGRITVNLAPADLPKEGGRFDLPIAVGILVASAKLPQSGFDGTELYGELSLGGTIHGIRGALPTALAATREGNALIVPTRNVAETALVRSGRIYHASRLLEVCSHARGFERLPIVVESRNATGRMAVPELADVRGQPRARRALEIAAAGRHSLLMIGPPGAGKSMLAQRLPGLLPPMSEEEALEAAAVRSLTTRGFRVDDWRRRPYRSPHHTVSGIALVGGGAHPRPGEISLAHNGVLFLDELPEFDRHALETLREPLETGQILISRNARQAEFPARFQLVAAMNPCPCGHLGDPAAQCRCPSERIEAYRSRVSGPLLDRIDLHVEVPRLPAAELRGIARSDSTEVVAERVAAAHHRQLVRQGRPNATLSAAELSAILRVEHEATTLLERASEKLGLSARAYHRILRVALTIADLAADASVKSSHVAEAITWRQFDRGAGADDTAADSA